MTPREDLFDRVLVVFGWQVLGWWAAGIVGWLVGLALALATLYIIEDGGGRA